MKNRFLFYTLLLFAILVAACAPQATPAPTQEPAPTEMMEEPTTTPLPEPTATPEPAPQTIVDTAIADGRFTTLVAAVQAAGLAETLSSEGPFTVFAPTDDAFAALPEGTVEALLAEIPTLTNILLYHVVDGKVMAADVVGLESAPTLLGENVTVTVEGNTVKINDATVIITDIEASNGVIHVIDTVLLPPTPEEAMMVDTDIVDTAVADGRFTTLAAALQAAGLVDALKAEGPFTVFAPTDDAFAALPEGTVEALLADIPTLTNILLYHVVEGKVMAADVVGLETAPTLLGENVTVTVEGDTVKINDATVIITDIETRNGVIHVIDTVLLPPAPEETMMFDTDIVETAVADGRFTTLVAALEAAGLVDALKAEGLFTVFAPTDDAFAALPEGTVEALLADIPTLTNILLYHVVEGKVQAADVVTLSSATTLKGEDVTITVEDGVVKINDATVIITNLITTNGVIHVIDMVLLPPTE